MDWSHLLRVNPAAVQSNGTGQEIHWDNWRHFAADSYNSVPSQRNGWCCGANAVCYPRNKRGNYEESLCQRLREFCFCLNRIHSSWFHDVSVLTWFSVFSSILADYTSRILGIKEEEEEQSICSCHYKYFVFAKSRFRMSTLVQDLLLRECMFICQTRTLKTIFTSITLWGTP